MAAVGASLIVAATVVLTLVFAREGARASNQLVNYGQAAVLPPGGLLCQRGEQVPENTRAIRFFTGTPDTGAGPVEVSVDGPGAPSLRGRNRRRFVTGPVAVRLGPVVREITDATVCVRNAGRDFISVGGTPVEALRLSPLRTRIERPADVDGVPQLGRIRLEYPGGGRRAVQMIGKVTKRASLVKATFVGVWTIWLALSVSVVTSVLAAAYVIREGSR